jgi:adenylate kinase
VVLVTGVPGTGKTSISKLLARLLDGNHIELSRFVKEKGIILETDIKRDTKIVNFDILKKKIKGFIMEASSALIIDGHYSHEIVPPKLVTKVFVLRRAPWQLKEELYKRGYNYSKIWENIEAELIGICLIETREQFEDEKICEIDTSTLTIQDTSKLMHRIIEKRVSCKINEVDWISNHKTMELLKGKKRCI